MKIETKNQLSEQLLFYERRRHKVKLVPIKPKPQEALDNFLQTAKLLFPTKSH